MSQQQRWQIQEQQLKLQIVQLETALKADLVDKNEILDKIKAERDQSEKLTEENKKLQIQFLEQKQQLDELSERLKFYSRENEYDVAELTEALLLIKTRRSQKNGDLLFLKEVEDGASSVRKLRAAHAETIQELQKTRNILSMETKICKDYKAELEAGMRKMDADRVEYEQKLERQAQLLDTRAAKIKKLEAQLKDIAYGTKPYVFKLDATAEDEANELDETLCLERGENLFELQIVGAALSSPGLEVLGDGDPSTFFTYSFYLFELHSTPVVTGHKPKYGFTSKYVVSMDDHFLDYLHRCSVTVELHQAIGLDWRTLASGQLPLQQLLEQDGKVHGTIPLIGTSEEVRSFGSVDYWLQFRIPISETIRLFKEKVKAAGYIQKALNQVAQVPAAFIKAKLISVSLIDIILTTVPPETSFCSSMVSSQLPGSSSLNQLDIAVRRCRDLRSRSSQQPSPYVVYKFSDFPDYPTATIHDSCDPHFNDLKSYSVPMEADLDQYLKSEVLQFYVFDDKEEQMDEYVGKARVPLLLLAQDQEISGVFKLSDPSGHPAGHIEVTLKWRFTYCPPSGSIMTVEEPKLILKEDEKKDGGTDEMVQEEEKGKEKEEEARDLRHLSTSVPEASVSKARLPKLRHQPQVKVKDGPAAKKVTFIDPTAADTQQVDESSSAKKRQTSSPVQHVLAPSPQRTTEEEEEDEESHFSEGQLMPVSSQSDDSEISEIIEDVDASAAKDDCSESTQSDSDDCIVHGQTAARKPSDRVRVEIQSLSLRPGSRVARDSSVVRLFVEYSLLDLPTEETPLSLPKPGQGQNINYNYSKVVPVDAENNAARRQLLRRVLQGRNPQMERIRFTVVSEPPEEEEQEKECEDVGVAFMRINEILERRRDLTETSLDVVDVEDSSEVVGSLTVSVEGLDALQAIMEDQDLDQEQTHVSSLLPST
ncbi:protein fantom isoform X1 [Larimichthys crocea]|uniref:protein fantom isoform X1 n=1 Tax=Larimichthys crocea TaxID=215358 RepID=UPI000F602531|nr:protein fantom isoform X1 [Larimichthys crocea]